MRYLWLVLPFWQAIQSVTEKADQLSPFIWSDAVEKEAGDRTEDRTEVGDGTGDRTEGGDESEEPNFKNMHQSKQWTSKRMRKIM